MSSSKSVKINNEKVEIIEDDEKYYKIEEYYSNKKIDNEVIINNIKKNLKKIEKLIYNSSSFIEIVKSAVPTDIYQAILTDNEKTELAKGSIELMTSKSGKLYANLIDPKSKKIVSNINLEKIRLNSDFNKALIDFNNQIQIAEIAEEIHNVQKAVEEVRKGQENDRIAIAEACEQKLLQASSITDRSIRETALLNLTSSAEDARNKLMLNQNENIAFLKKQPKNFWKKLAFGHEEDVNRRLLELRESINAFNKISLTEALAYRELGEVDASNLSLNYYANYIKKTYLSDKDFLERLDSLSPSKNRYWSKSLPNITKKIQLLNNRKENILLEDIKDEK